MNLDNANRLIDYIRLEQKKLDFELNQAIARVELLQKHRVALELQLNQAMTNQTMKRN
jgi:RNase P/RNase MRP subunit p30